MKRLHRITREFRDRMRALGEKSPAAEEFLAGFADHPPADVELSTETNAHLYVHKAFVAYVKLGTPEPPGTLRWSPLFNHRIADPATDAGHALLPGTFDSVVERHSGWAAGWAKQEPDGVRVIGIGAPKEFFDDLRKTIIGLDPRAVP